MRQASTRAGWLLVLCLVACASPPAAEPEIHRDPGLGIGVALAADWMPGPRLHPLHAEWLAVHAHARNPQIDVFTTKQQFLQRWRLSFRHRTSDATVAFLPATREDKTRSQVFEEVTVEMRRTFPDVEWNGEIESQQVDGRSFERMSLTDAESGRTEIVVLIRQVEDMELLCISTQLAGRTELLDEFLGGVFFLEAPLR